MDFNNNTFIIILIVSLIYTAYGLDELKLRVDKLEKDMQYATQTHAQ